MSRLALGTAQFGLPYGVANNTGQVLRTEAKAMLGLALASGIDTLDTAIAYGDSEMCLGEIGTQDFKLITKLPLVPNSCADINAWVLEQINASLYRLGVKEIYGVLLHRSDQFLSSNGAEIHKALQGLKNRGLVKKVGASIYSPAELDALIPLYQLDLVQVPFNLIDRRLYSSGWLKRLKKIGVEVHTRSAFLQGLLLLKPDDLPLKFSPWSSLWREWYGWLDTHEISALQASLAFPMSFSEIDRVVVGADSANQLAQIITATSQPFSLNMPNIQCADLNLINPTNWNQL